MPQIGCGHLKLELNQGIEEGAVPVTVVATRATGVRPETELLRDKCRGETTAH